MTTWQIISPPDFYPRGHLFAHFLQNPTELGLNYSPPQADVNEVKFIFWECSSSLQQSELQVCPSPLQERGSEILK